MNKGQRADIDLKVFVKKDRVDAVLSAEGYEQNFSTPIISGETYKPEIIAHLVELMIPKWREIEEDT